MGHITCDKAPQLISISKGSEGPVYEANDLAEVDVGGSTPQTVAAFRSPDTLHDAGVLEFDQY